MNLGFLLHKAWAVNVSTLCAPPLDGKDSVTLSGGVRDGPSESALLRGKKQQKPGYQGLNLHIHIPFPYPKEAQGAEKGFNTKNRPLWVLPPRATYICKGTSHL